MATPKRDMSKLRWLVKYISKSGQVVYVKRQGTFFLFVTDISQATAYPTKPEAEDFAETVKRINHAPDRVSVIGASL